MDVPQYTVSDLLRVMQRLRDPQTGCPWDLEQDFRSIVPSTLEECYELAHAIEHEDYSHVAEELGDVLFQVVFYSQLGKEQNLFSFGTVVSTLVEKLLRRHPHVFAEGKIEGLVTHCTSIGAVRRTWEEIKQGERDNKNNSGALADIPLALPALPRAQKVQKRAAQHNFDWSGTPAVLEKLQEELEELRVAMAGQQGQNVREEMGDVLFTCVNLARHLGLDAEQSLRHATTKFERRFAFMEANSAAAGSVLAEMSEEQLDELWRLAKEQLGSEKRGL